MQRSCHSEVQVRGSIEQHLRENQAPTAQQALVYGIDSRNAGQYPAATTCDDCDVISARDVRRIILEQSRRADIGHIGCALSVADILAALYGPVMRIQSPAPERDCFILSKGHAALALRGPISPGGSQQR